MEKYVTRIKILERLYRFTIEFNEQKQVLPQGLIEDIEGLYELVKSNPNTDIEDRLCGLEKRILDLVDKILEEKPLFDVLIK